MTAGGDDVTEETKGSVNASASAADLHNCPVSDVHIWGFRSLVAWAKRKASHWLGATKLCMTGEFHLLSLASVMQAGVGCLSKWPAAC